MRICRFSISALALLFACVLTLMAQTTNPFVGKWQLNVAKSKFSPGPGPKSETVTVEQSKTTVEGTDPNGQPFKWSFTPSPGKAVRIEGFENEKITQKITGNTVNHTWSGVQNTHGHGVVS